MAPFIVRAVVVTAALEHADSVVASHGRWAVCVSDAGARDPDALNGGVSGEAGRTAALLPVLRDAALGVQSARVNRRAGIFTAAANTQLRCPTVRIHQTSH